MDSLGHSLRISHDLEYRYASGGHRLLFKKKVGEWIEKGEWIEILSPKNGIPRNMFEYHWGRREFIADILPHT